jgi:hypothetical protein
LGAPFYEKLEQWFTVIGRELHDSAISAQNVYNMDETGILMMDALTQPSISTSGHGRLCTNYKEQPLSEHK